MSHCLLLFSCLVNAGGTCTCDCSGCRAARDKVVRDCLFHVWVRDNGDEVLTSAPPKVWCRCRLCGARSPLLYYEDPVRDELRKRVAALEAENSELKVRDSNVTFHSRNVMAVNQDLAKRLADLEGKAR